MVEIDQGNNNDNDQERIGREVPVTLVAPSFNPKKGIVELTRYTITGGLTLLSSFGLEVVAIGGATITAGINPFANLDAKYAVGAVVVSYIPYLTSLFKNADQSWKSLQETGISVNIFAKAGYDLSKNITGSQKLQKFSAYSGFLGSELAKEIPWYIGAFAGKEIMSGWVPELYTPNIEYAFLAGANVFAAGYLYAQAGGVELALRYWRNRNRIGNLLCFGKNSTNQEKSKKDLP